MATRRIHVFFYGLFMDVDLLKAKGVNPINIRPASAPGFALRIGQRATLLRHPHGLAHGMLMEMTHLELDRLYAEPGLQAYRPEEVLCRLDDGSQLPALCFNLAEAPRLEEAN